MLGIVQLKRGLVPKSTIIVTEQAVL